MSLEKNRTYGHFNYRNRFVGLIGNYVLSVADLTIYNTSDSYILRIFTLIKLSN